MDKDRIPVPLRILLVEDNHHDRVAFVRAMNKSGLPFEVTECIRAGEALDKLRNSAPGFHLAVVDHDLPGRSGIDLCKQVLQEENAVPVVILTGRGSEQLAIEALKAGVDDYIIKDHSHHYLDLLGVVLPEVVRKHGDRVARKKAEEALRKSEKEKEAVLNSMSELVAYLDRDQRVLWANRAAGESVGLPPEELAGRRCHQVWHGRDKPCKECPAVKACETGEAEGMELVSSDGRAWFIRAYPVRSENGDIAGVVEVILEITDRKRAEEELRQRNEELKNFAYIVSHDLKNPIAFIQGYSTVLMENCGDKMDEKGRMCLNRILASVGRMDALVSDLLALSKIGQVVSTFEDVSAVELMRHVTSGLQDRLKSKGIKLVVQDNPPTVHCDGDRICQVLDNLIVNAIKFIGDTEHPRIEVGCLEKAGFHQFYVKDNGIGIDPRDHQKIFETFHRLKQVEDDEGTGLGLSIVKRIVKNHGGEVWVESEPGAGATFFFTIPWHQ